MTALRLAFPGAAPSPGPMPSLLFIAPVGLGETVLATGVLASAQEKLAGAAVTVVCTPEAAPLFRAAPGLERICFWRGGSGFRAALRLARELARERFDVAVDLSIGGASRLVRTTQRCVSPRADTWRQRVEEWSVLVGAEALAPKLWLDARAQEEANAAALGAGPLIVLAAGADAPGKRWPAERFAAVARRLVGGPLVGARVVLIGGEEDAEVARAVAHSLDADGVAARDCSGSLDLLAQAALLARATLFIGNDTPVLHLAAAMKAPTLGLFGASDERVRGPAGPRTRALRGRPFEATRAPLDERALMNELSVDEVEAAALELLRAGGL